jgi:hypothetical protein
MRFAPTPIPVERVIGAYDAQREALQGLADRQAVNTACMVAAYLGPLYRAGNQAPSVPTPRVAVAPLTGAVEFNPFAVAWWEQL